MTNTKTKYQTDVYPYLHVGHFPNSDFRFLNSQASHKFPPYAPSKHRSSKASNNILWSLVGDGGPFLSPMNRVWNKKTSPNCFTQVFHTIRLFSKCTLYLFSTRSITYGSYKDCNNLWSTITFNSNTHKTWHKIFNTNKTEVANNNFTTCKNKLYGK